MSKIGVGIGEDFPVDDPREDTAHNERAGWTGSDADHDARREAHRKWHEARREWKRQWRDEWRSRRGEFRSRFKDSYYDGHARPYMGFGHPFAFGPHMLWRAVAVVAAIAAVVFLFSHIYIVLGALVVAALVAAAWHRGFDPFDLPAHRYDRRDARREDREPPRQQPPASEPPRDSAH